MTRFTSDYSDFEDEPKHADASGSSQVFLDAVNSIRAIDLYTRNKPGALNKGTASQDRSGRLQTFKPSETSTERSKIECPAEAGNIAIPTQRAYGKINLADCTQYAKDSKQARDFDKVKYSVVKIDGERKADGWKSSPYASGFVVTPDGMVATDLHVLRNLKNVRVTMEGGNSYKASVAAVDRRHDLAILQIDRKQNELFRAMPLGSSQLLKSGEDVTAWGFPLNSDRLFMSPAFPNFGFRERLPLKKALENGAGKPLSLTDLNKLLLSGERSDREMLESTNLVNRGNSGGPLTDASNQAIGIIGLSDGSYTAIATPVEPVKRLLQFARQERGKTDARIYFDENDITDGDTPLLAEERVRLRANRLELEISTNSIADNLQPLLQKPGASMLSTDKIATWKPKQR